MHNTVLNEVKNKHSDYLNNIYKHLRAQASWVAALVEITAGKPKSELTARKLE